MATDIKEAEGNYTVPPNASFGEKIKLDVGKAVVMTLKKIDYVETGEHKFLSMSMVNEQGEPCTMVGWLTSGLTKEDGSPGQPGQFDKDFKENFVAIVNGQMVLKPELVDAKVEIAKIQEEGMQHHNCGLVILEQPNAAK